MELKKLPSIWRKAGERLRGIAATYPEYHVAHYGLLNRVDELERCAKELEEALAVAGRLLDPERLSLAIEAVETGLQATGRQLSPGKMSTLVMAAYELIDEE